MSNGFYNNKIEIPLLGFIGVRVQVNNVTYKSFSTIITFIPDHLENIEIIRAILKLLHSKAYEEEERWP